MRHEANGIDAFDESKSFLRMSLSDLEFRLLRANQREFFSNRDKFSSLQYSFQTYSTCDRLKIQNNSNKLNNRVIYLQ